MVLDSVRILLVEDNFVVADSLRALLLAYGGTVVAMVPSVAEALAIVDSESVDVAVLDIHVKDGTVEPLADRLSARRIPFLFLTGYGDDGLLPERMRGRPRLDKPVEPERLVDALAALMRRA